jgi:hypothetical protein
VVLFDAQVIKMAYGPESSTATSAMDLVLKTVARALEALDRTFQGNCPSQPSDLRNIARLDRPPSTEINLLQSFDKLPEFVSVLHCAHFCVGMFCLFPVRPFLSQDILLEDKKSFDQLDCSVFASHS